MPGKLIKDGDCYDLEPLAKASVGRIASGLSRHIAQDIQTCGYIAWKIKTHQNIAWETEKLAKDSAWEGRSPLQLLLLHAPHLAGQLVDHVQGDAEVNLGRGRSQHLKLSNIYWMRGGVPQQYGILHQCWSPAHFFCSKKIKFAEPCWSGHDGSIINHLALKLLLWGLKHFLQLGAFPLNILHWMYSRQARIWSNLNKIEIHPHPQCWP